MDRVVVDTRRASDEVAAYFERLGRPKTARRGDVLLRQGEPAGICYYVKRGYAKVLSTSETGHATLIGFAGPRDVIGQAAAHTWGETYIFTSIASSHMDLSMWTREMVLSPQQRVLRCHVGMGRGESRRTTRRTYARMRSAVA